MLSRFPGLSIILGHMPRILVGAIVLLTAITLYGVFDCLLRDRRHIRIMPKWAWVLVILFVPVFGLALWYVFGRSSFRPREDSGPVAPDDDPEFLRRIADDVEAEKRRRKHAEDAEERRRAESGTGSAADGRRPVDGSATADDPDLPDAQRHRDEQNRPGPDDPRM